MPTTKYDYGRIRLWKHTAVLLGELLANERDLLCLARKNRPKGEASTDYNLRIKHIDQIQAELTRMLEEKGWDDAEA